MADPTPAELAARARAVQRYHAGLVTDFGVAHPSLLTRTTQMRAHGIHSSTIENIFNSTERVADPDAGGRQVTLAQRIAGQYAGLTRHLQQELQRIQHLPGAANVTAAAELRAELAAVRASSAMFTQARTGDPTALTSLQTDGVFQGLIAGQRMHVNLGIGEAPTGRLTIEPFSPQSDERPMFRRTSLEGPAPEVPDGPSGRVAPSLDA